MTEPSPLDFHRQQFPALADKAYFNYGGQGPMPQASLDAIYQSYEYIQRQGPFSTGAGNWVVEEGKKTRTAIATELNVPVETISLTEDVTVGCNIGLWGIDWQPGDGVLLSDCEHPGIIATVRELQRRFKIEISVCPLMATLNQGDPVAVVKEHLQPNTRLVVLSHVLWNTGQVLPLADIAQAIQDYSKRDRPIRLLIDAAQSVGMLPLNLTEIGADFYAFTGHKWFCGPEGVGGLYVRPEALEDLNPTFIGWRSIIMSPSGEPIGWQPNGQRFEVATSAYPLYTGLQSAIATHQKWGTPQERYQQILKLSQSLWEGLNAIPEVVCLRQSPPESGLVSFQLKNKAHAQLVQFLESENIFVRTIRDPDCVRASVHYFTHPAEIERLLEGIKEFKG